MAQALMSLPWMEVPAVPFSLAQTWLLHLVSEPVERKSLYLSFYVSEFQINKWINKQGGELIILCSVHTTHGRLLECTWMVAHKESAHGRKHCSFAPQMAKRTRARPIRSWEPRASTELPIWGQGPKGLSQLPLLSQAIKQVTGLEVE